MAGALKTCIFLCEKSLFFFRKKISMFSDHLTMVSLSFTLDILASVSYFALLRLSLPCPVYDVRGLGDFVSALSGCAGS